MHLNTIMKSFYFIFFPNLRFLLSANVYLELSLYQINNLSPLSFTRFMLLLVFSSTDSKLLRQT